MIPTPSPKATRTKQTLQQAARQVFAEHGWHGTTVKRIVSLANVSHGTFYTYYPNRQMLLIELIEASVQPFLDLVDQPWKGDTHYLALRSIVQNFFDIYHDHAAIMDVWQEASTQDGGIAEQYNQLRSRFTARIDNRFQTIIRFVKADQLIPTTAVVQALISMVEQHAKNVSERHADRDEAIDALVLIWAGTLNLLVGSEFVEIPAS